MKIKFTSSDWRVKPVAIKNKTVRTLKNGKVIETWLSMERRIAKFE